MTEADLEERMARLAARRAGRTSPEPVRAVDPPLSERVREPAARRTPTRAAATARVVATGASIGGTLGLVAAMALGDRPAATGEVAVTEAAASAEPAPAPPPPPPVIRIIYRPVPVGTAAPTTAAAPTPTQAQSSSRAAAAPARTATAPRRPAAAAAPARRPAATTSRAS